MEQKDFIKLCTRIFKKNGLIKHNSSYYRDFDNDIILVFGLQKSAYGGSYYYIEYGFIFKSINKYMPYPKYHQANIRQGRVKIDGTVAMEYELLSEEVFSEHLNAILNETIEVATGGKEFIVDYSILGTKRAVLIQGYDTLPYLGVDKTNIQVAPL